MATAACSGENEMRGSQKWKKKKKKKEQCYSAWFLMRGFPDGRGLVKTDDLTPLMEDDFLHPKFHLRLSETFIRDNLSFTYIHEIS